MVFFLSLHNNIYMLFVHIIIHLYFCLCHVHFFSPIIPWSVALLRHCSSGAEHEMRYETKTEKTGDICGIFSFELLTDGKIYRRFISVCCLFHANCPYRYKPEHKRQNWDYFFSRFLSRNLLTTRHLIVAIEITSNGMLFGRKFLHLFSPPFLFDTIKNKLNCWIVNAPSVITFSSNSVIVLYYFP